MATRPVFGAAEVSVGKVSFKNVDLVALSAVRGPEVDWDGILGNELIRLLPLTLDYGAARARFGGPGLTEGLPIRFDRGIPVLPIQVAGERGRARTSFGDFAVMEAPLAASVTAGTTPLPVQAVGWPSPRPGGNLGSRGMAGLSVTIDATAQLARVERSGASPRCPG